MIRNISPGSKELMCRLIGPSISLLPQAIAEKDKANDFAREEKQ